MTPLPERRLLDPEIRKQISLGILNAPLKDSADIAKFLLDVGFSPSVSVNPEEGMALASERTKYINDSLVYAAETGALHIAKMLLGNYDAHVNLAQTPQNTNALYRAAGSGHVEIIRLLVQDHGADLHIGNGRYSNGPTALFIAVLNRQHEAVKMLLELGGPVASIDERIGSTTTVVFAVAKKERRAPIHLSIDRPDYEEIHTPLEYPGGIPWLGKVCLRKGDAELQRVGRELRIE